MVFEMEWIGDADIDWRSEDSCRNIIDAYYSGKHIVIHFPSTPELFATICELGYDQNNDVPSYIDIGNGTRLVENNGYFVQMVQHAK